MAKRSYMTYRVKEMLIEEWQIFEWTYEATLQPVIIGENGKIGYGESYQKMCTDGVYIVKGLVRFCTNGSYAKYYDDYVTPEFIDKDEKSQIVLTNRYMTPSWKRHLNGR